MKRSTAALLTGALSAGTFATLATIAPGIASANCATDIPVTSQQLNGWVLNPQGIATAGSSAEITENGLELTIAANGRAGAAYTVPGVPLSEQTAQSNYGFGPDSDVVGTSYQLVMDLNRPASDGISSDFAQFVYEPSARDEWYSTRVLPAAGIGDGRQNQEDTGTLAEISAAYPDAVITGLILQLGQISTASEATFTTARFGCNTFAFGNPVEVSNTAPVANLTVTDAGDDDYRTFFLDARAQANPSTDAETPNGLTYEIYVDGELVTTNPNHLFTASGPGTYTARLVVSDGSLTDEDVQTITVAVPADTVQGEPLPDTGANVIGLAVMGALAVGGAGTGLAVRSRRRSDSAV